MKISLIKSVKNLNKFERILWIVSLIVVTASFVAGGSGDLLTLAASLTGVTALIFIARGDVMGQLLTVAFSLLYAAVSWEFRYYGEMATYVGMTMPIAIASVVTWLKNPYGENEVAVGSMTLRKWLILIIADIGATVLFYFILKALGTANLIVSTISVTTSFLAAGLAMLRSPFYAAAYASNDLVLIVLWVYASLSDLSFLPMVLCFVMFFVNDMYGFYSWRRMLRRQKGEK
ncbi:MAG: nicotinamide riboside transporter PnuC [Oscillospiraceae bacterium]